MGHSLYEAETSDIGEQIKAWEEVAEKARSALSTLITIRERFPDIQDAGRFAGPRRWTSYAAHEIADHVDPHCLGSRTAFGVLYVALPDGGRVYSARPVDSIAAFDAFQANGYRGNLVDALKSTTRDAEAAHKSNLEREAKQKEERDAEEAKRREEAAASEANPVRIIGTVALKKSDV